MCVLHQVLLHSIGYFIGCGVPKGYDTLVAPLHEDMAIND